MSKGIADALAKMHDLQEVDLYLTNFEIPTPHNYGNFETRHSYVISTLQSASPDDLVEMADDLGVDTTNIARSNDMPPKIWQNTPTFRLFISHISNDKDKASRLRDCLKPYHISGFVAHEDIHPTQLWQSEIERGLRTMDAFIAIHTKGFSESIWTQQEIGFAVARDVKIISFKMGEDPTGFISKAQALPRLKKTAEEIASEVQKLLKEDHLTKYRLAQVVTANNPMPNPNEIAF